MKVLKGGTKVTDKPYMATCRTCECVFQFQRGEARYVPDDRDGAAVVIACPECRNECWVAA